MTVRYPRARTHNLRKGQWLVHNIFNMTHEAPTLEEITRRLLAMENDIFEKIMNGYEEGEWTYPMDNVDDGWNGDKNLRKKQ